MKFKKSIKKILEVTAGLSAGYITYLILKARAFKKTCDINKNSLDVVALFKNLNINYVSQPIRDFKIGCFIGIINCNLSKFQFDQPITELSITIEQGIVTLFVPENINLVITPNTLYPKNILNYHKNQEKSKNLLIINTNIKFGLLIIKNSSNSI